DGTVNLASNIGSVDQQAGSGNSISTGRLNVDAATDIVLAGDNFVDTLGNLSAGGSITYDGHGFTTLGGNVHAGGALTMNVTGTIHQ
ncbi:hypothetical protein, partial [Escherichia coli]